MKTELEIIKEKIRKLLALSKSDNENEAAIALEKANDLISKYNIDEASLHYESLEIKSTKMYMPWRSCIANAVSWLYCCCHYRDKNNGTFVFTGEKLYVFMAAQMFDYLVKTIERCSKKAVRRNAKLKFRRDFKFGMALRLYDRIMILGESCAWCSVRDIKIEEAKEFIGRSVEIITNKNKNLRLNRTAVNRGIIHGNNVSLARQTGFTPPAQLT